jgi:hypothetical protein
MLPLAIQIRVEAPAERRSAPRHAVGLAVSGTIRAVVENISETGLALRTNAPLAVGDRFDVELPLAGMVPARVAWTEDELVGCEFAVPIGKAAVSAARLRSPFDAPEPAATALAVAGAASPPAPRYDLAIGVMLAFAAVAAMFIAAMMTAPFSTP